MTVHVVDESIADGQYQALQLRTNAKIARYQARLELAKRGLRDTLIAVRAESPLEGAEPLPALSMPPPLPMLDRTRTSRKPAVPPALTEATAKSSGWVAKISSETGLPAVIPISEERLGRRKG